MSRSLRARLNRLEEHERNSGNNTGWATALQEVCRRQLSTMARALGMGEPFTAGQWEALAKIHQTGLLARPPLT